MKVVCISASNVEMARDCSASTRACTVVQELVTAQKPDAEVEIVPLLDYEMKPCRMCGRCFETGRCALDPAFNRVYEKLIAADAIFLVCPHYAPFPSKVMILLEKLQEMVFLRGCADRQYHFTLYRKPLGLIAHGGQTAEALPYYKTALVEPLANAFASVQMKIIGAGEPWPSGVAFGITGLSQRPGSIFVDITHDWEEIRTSLSPLVRNVMTCCES